MTKRWEIAALVLITIIIVAALSLAYHEDRSAGITSTDFVIRSSYRSYPQGYKALYMALETLGYDTRRTIRPYSLLTAPGTLIVADPYSKAKNQQDVHPPVSAYEARKLFEWLRRGNYALIAIEKHPAYLTRLHMAVQQRNKNKDNISDADLEWITRFSAVGLKGDETIARAVGGAVFPTQQAATLGIKSTCRFPEDQLLPPSLLKTLGTTRPLYRDSAGIVACYSPVGKGGIVWCSSPWSFSNQGIDRQNNLDLVLALVKTHADGRVLFDEYHHGYGADMTVWDLAPAATRLGIVQCAVAIVLLLVTLGWRFGPVRLPAEERFTRSRAEYLTSMAGLLQRNRAIHLVCDQVMSQLCRQLSRRLNLPGKTPLEQLIERNAHSPVVEPIVLELLCNQLNTVRAQAHPDAAQVLRIARGIDRLLRAK